VSERQPLSTLLSQVLVAFTMEFDNEAERQFAESAPQAFLVSQVMWANLMRFVDDEGVAIRDIPERAGVPGTPVSRGWIHGCLAGMERWGYIRIGPAPDETRAKPRRADLLVQPTESGRKARAVWLPLAEVVEEEWRARFGDAAIDALRSSLQSVVGRVNEQMPAYLPVVTYADGMLTAVPHLDAWDVGDPPGEDSSPPDLPVLLAHALLLLAVDFERESSVSLAISANALRVIEDGTPVKALPTLTGVSKEAIKASLGFLERHDFAIVEDDPDVPRTKVVRLTQNGHAARDSTGALLAVVEARWHARFGTEAIETMHAALDALLDHPQLSEGLSPDPSGWRARKPYVAQTTALVSEPRAALPHYPMVLHRGGWPDGS